MSNNRYITGDDTHNEIDTAIAAGASLAEPNIIPNTVLDEEKGVAGIYTVVPNGYHVEDLEKFLPKPLRVRQNVALEDTVSFISYLREFANTVVTRVFFATGSEQFTAIIDYHQTAQDADWCDHVATYTPQRSPEFKTWMGKNRTAMTQVDFARFLEDNMPDVVQPASSDLLNIALSFEAKKSAEFSSGVRLANGQIQLQYTEQIRGSASNGTIEVPEKFVLGIPIHVNGPAYRIEAKLRWRLQEGKVTFWYELVRPEKSVEHAVNEIRALITRETAIQILTGSAE